MVELEIVSEIYKEAFYFTMQKAVKKNSLCLIDNILYHIYHHHHHHHHFCRPHAVFLFIVSLGAAVVTAHASGC
jgi:hypothetical protein